MNTASYLQNRSFSRIIDYTPYELWNGKKPDIKYLATFGIKCFVHIPNQKRRKLDIVVVSMIFVGYDTNSKAYRCYDFQSQKIVISRDVRFSEK